MRLIAVAALLVSAVLTGCDGPPRVSTARQSATAGPSPVRTTPPQPQPGGERVRVPDVTGMETATARARLVSRGLREKATGKIYASCLRPDRVERQQPPPGQLLRAGSKVALTITRPGVGPCGLDLPHSGPESREIGVAFVAFARGRRTPAARFAPEVALIIGSRVARTFNAEEATRLRSWRGCGGQNGYAARTCPFSAVRPLRDYPGPIAITSDPPSHPCVEPAPVPAAYEALARVTLRADEPKTCIDYVAVEILIDAQHRIAGAHVVWAEP